MEANKNGIALTKAELRALREFASKEITDRDRFGVQFEIDGERVYARATNSRICIQFDGISDGKHPDGEWFVEMKFLIDGRKELEGKQVLRLDFKGASLHDAFVEENGVRRGSWSSETDAAVAQSSFPQFSKSLKIPSKSREIVHCMALAPAYMKAVGLAAEAVDEELVEFFPPSTPDGVVVFRAGTEKSTSVIGGIKANVTAEAVKEDDDEEEDDEDEKRKRGRKKNPKQPELPGAEAAS